MYRDTRLLFNKYATLFKFNDLWVYYYKIKISFLYIIFIVIYNILNNFL